MRDTQTSLILSLVESLDSRNPKTREKAFIALDQISIHPIMKLLMDEMVIGSTPEDKWNAIRGVYLVMKNSGPGQIRQIAEIMQERMEDIGDGPVDGHKEFARVALSKLKEASAEMARDKEDDLRSILSAGRIKPPRAKRAKREKKKRQAKR